MCLDGSCISLSLLCNFKRDCEDGDDENDCGNFLYIKLDPADTQS